MSRLKGFVAAVSVVALSAAAGLGVGEMTRSAGAVADPATVVKGAKAPVRHSEIAGMQDSRIDQSRIESAAVVTHVEVIGAAKDAKIVLLDPNGDVVYRTDPTANTTVIAKDVMVPSVTVRESEGDTAELRIVAADSPARAPVALAKALEHGERINAQIFYRDDL